MIKVTLKSGFVGYAFDSEFFIVGSIVKCYNKIPRNFKDYANIKSETGIVADIAYLQEGA